MTMSATTYRVTRTGGGDFRVVCGNELVRNFGRRRADAQRFADERNRQAIELAVITPEHYATARELLRQWIDTRDTRFPVEDFVGLCDEDDMEGIAHQIMEDAANRDGTVVDDATYCALTGVVEDWQEGGYVCQVCEELTARTAVLGGGPQVVHEQCQEELTRHIYGDTKSQTLVMSRVRGLGGPLADRR